MVQVHADVVSQRRPRDGLVGGVPPPPAAAPPPPPSGGAGGPLARPPGRAFAPEPAGAAGPGRRLPPAVAAEHGQSVRAPGRPEPSRDLRVAAPGRGDHLPPAVVLEPDPFVRPAVEDAVRRLGFRPALEPAPVVFVDLARMGACPAPGGVGPPSVPVRDQPGGWGSSAAPTVIGFVAGRPLTGVAHLLHGCCSEVLELRPGPDGVAFGPLALPPALAAAGLTPREADVLALLLLGLSGCRIATLLGVTPSTVRTHARAVLRKVGVADRRTLRTLDVPERHMPHADRVLQV